MFSFSQNSIVPYKIEAYIQHIYSILAVYLCSIPAVQLQHCCNHAATFLPFNYNAGSMNAACFKYVNYAASMLQICKLCCNAVYTAKIRNAVYTASSKSCSIYCAAVYTATGSIYCAAVYTAAERYTALQYILHLEAYTATRSMIFVIFIYNIILCTRGV